MHPRVVSIVPERLGSEACICNFKSRSFPVDVTIIGTGNMSRGIATRVLAGGHSVTLLGTAPEKAEALAAELDGDVRAGSVGDALAGDVAVLAVWYQAVDDVLATYGDQLAGKVVVDITNPVDTETYAPLAVEEGSVSQHIAARVPGARVVKAFNTTFAGTLVEGTVAGQPLDVFLAGDDDAAKDIVKQLVRDGGLRPVDAGPLALAHHVEALGYLNMAIQPDLGTNYASAVKVLA
jgi:8-hydroxy-5-deazaflavin:NADPH oxidoreductase